MRSLWVLGLSGLLLGGCSFLAHDAVKGRCSLTPPVVDTGVALAGFVTAGAALSDTDADAEAHGQDEIIHATFTLPALVFAFSAIYGFLEVNKCAQRASP